VSGFSLVTFLTNVIIPFDLTVKKKLNLILETFFLKNWVYF